MELLLFHHEKWLHLYNCTPEVSQKAAPAEDDIWYGCLLIAGALFFGVLYIPCMMVLFRRDVRQRSSMKIMLALGITDFVGLFNAGLLSGVYVIYQSVFCSAPLFNFITGVVATSTWCASCWICVLLAGSRCVELFSDRIHRRLFDGYRTWLWLALPLLFQLYIALFTLPAVFTANGNMWLFDPFFGFEIDYDASQFQNIPHTSNNLVTPLILAVCYVLLCAILWLKYTRLTVNSHDMLAIQKKVAVQAIAICSFNFAASTFYAYVQFFPPPTYFNVIGHLSWLCCHGGPAVVYLFLNDTIRSGVRKLLRLSQTDVQIYNMQTTTVAAFVPREMMIHGRSCTEMN